MAEAGQTIEEFDELLKGFNNELNGLLPGANILGLVEAATIQVVQRDGNEKSVSKYKKVPNGKRVFELFRSTT